MSTANQSAGSAPEPRNRPTTGRPAACKWANNSSGETRSCDGPKTRCHISALLRSVLRRVEILDDFEQILHDVVARLALGLGLKIRADAVSHHGDRGLADVVERHRRAAVHRRERLTRLHQVDAGP